MIKDIFDLYNDDFSTVSLEKYEKTVQSDIFMRLLENNRVAVLIILLSKYKEGANYADYSKQWITYILCPSFSSLSLKREQREYIGISAEKEETICLCGTKAFCTKSINLYTSNLIFLCDACQIKFADAKTGALSEHFGKKDWICPVCKTVEKCYVLRCKICEICQICKKNAISNYEIICEDCCKNIEKRSDSISEKIKLATTAKKELELIIQSLRNEGSDFIKKELALLNQNTLKKNSYLLMKAKQEEN